METVAAIATTVLAYQLSSDDVKQSMRRVYRGEPEHLHVVMQLCDQAHVARRYSAIPLDELVRPACCRSGRRRTRHTPSR